MKGKGERGQTGGYAWPGIDSTAACPGVGVAIKMRPRQAKHNVYVCVYISHVFRISFMGLPVLVLYVCMYVYMLYGLRSIVRGKQTTCGVRVADL